MTDEQIQAMLDAQAQAMGYDNITDAVSYAEEQSAPQFMKDGRRLRRWRSLVWAAQSNGTEIPPFEPVPEPIQEPTPEQALHNDLIAAYNLANDTQLETMEIRLGEATSRSIMRGPRAGIHIAADEQNVTDFIQAATAKVIESMTAVREVPAAPVVEEAPRRGPRRGPRAELI